MAVRCPHCDSPLTTEEAAQLIQKRLSAYLKDPYVSLFVTEYASQGASLLGEVAKPGVYPVLGEQHLFDLISAAGGRRDFGVVVDGVSDVVDVNTAEVKAAPELGAKGATDYIRGLVPISERMVVLLDIDRLIGSDMASFSNNDAETASAA